MHLVPISDLEFIDIEQVKRVKFENGNLTLLLEEGSLPYIVEPKFRPGALRVLNLINETAHLIHGE